MTDETVTLRRIAESRLGVPATLHEYQWEGVAFLYRNHSALLADEMGLGKTVQSAVALALLIHGNNEINRSLIVAPASLTMNWIMELSTWAPSLTVRRVQGTPIDREMYYLLPISVLVCSYEQIRYDGLDRIPSDTFDLVVLDEAQRIKNRNSATALACRLLPRRRAWALSATPLENEANDLVSILSFLSPLLKRELSQAQMARSLQSMMLRRKKKDVLANLPPVITQDLKIELSDPQKERYRTLWQKRVASIGTYGDDKEFSIAMLGLITRLKMLCNYDRITNTSSKLDALKLIIESAGNEARILVFSQFVETLKWVSDRIDLPHGLLTGSMPLEERQFNIDKFSNQSTPRGLLISLRAGGVGLNLGNATHVVVFDRWWNPAVEIQAVYRAHRFNRREPLHVIRFLITDTIEERISQILQHKEEVFEDIIESAESDSYRFTKQELMQILQLNNGESNCVQEN